MPASLAFSLTLYQQQMKEQRAMGDITISIEVRIEAGSESAARQYAAMHGIDATRAKWFANLGGKGGRLYAAAAAPFPNVPSHADSGRLPGAGNPLGGNPLGGNPEHDPLRSGAIRPE